LHTAAKAKLTAIKCLVSILLKENHSITGSWLGTTMVVYLTENWTVGIRPMLRILGGDALLAKGVHFIASAPGHQKP